jgi:hypothetical protein
MPAPTTNVKLSNIQTEFGGANPISMSEYYRGGTNVPSGTTSAYGTIPTSGAITVGVFRGTQKSTVLISDYSLTASVGSVFNGSAYAEMILIGTGANAGKLQYNISAFPSADPGRSTRIQTAGGSVIDSGEAAISGFITGEWLLAGSPSDYQVYITSASPYYAGSPRNTWTTMNTDVSIFFQTDINDAVDQTATIQIRSASTLQVLDSATYTVNLNAAGIN